MARRTPPRYKSGPKKGQFMPKSARGRKRARRSSSTQLSNPPKRRRRRRSSSSSSSSSPRRRRRRNPGMGGLSPKNVGKQLVQGAKDAGGVLLGKAAARAIPTHLNLPQAGLVGLAVQLGVAIAAGLGAHRFVNKDFGRFVLAGGISAPLETFIVAKNIPFLAPALSPNTGAHAIGAYADYRAIAPARPMASYARAATLQAYAGRGPGFSDGDY